MYNGTLPEHYANKQYKVQLTWYFCINSDPHTLRKVADVWLATALASRVLPALENVMSRCWITKLVMSYKVQLSCYRQSTA